MLFVAMLTSRFYIALIYVTRLLCNAKRIRRGAIKGYFAHDRDAIAGSGFHRIGDAGPWKTILGPMTDGG